MEVLVYEFEEDEYNRGGFEVLVPHSNGYIRFSASRGGRLDFQIVRSIEVYVGWHLYAKKMCNRDIQWLRGSCFVRCIDESLERMFHVRRGLTVNGKRWLRNLVCGGDGRLNSSWRLVE